MKRFLVVFGAMALLASSAHAATFVLLVQTPNLLNLALLALAGACSVGSFQVLTLVRGGMLAKSWQLFLAGFVMLTLAQLLSLFNAVQIMALPSYVLPLMYSGMAGLFLYGIFETRRTLS